MYRYRILGPIELDGSLVTAPQECRLLAILLLHRNRPISPEAVEQAVWLGASPPTAKATLQTKISRLRAELGAETVRLTSAGYVLRVLPNECDADRFEHLAADLLRGELKVGADRLRLSTEAMGLWHGAPFGDLAEAEFIEGEAVRLDQRRLAVGEVYLSALLDAGRDADVHDAVERFADDHPYHDRLCEFRMLALGRQGRHADALRAYHDYRSRLIDEIRIEPSPGLAAIERSILQHALPTVQPTTVVGGGAPVPPHSGGRRWNEPVDSRPPFVGREALVASLRRTINRGAGVRILLLEGDGGMGKTRVALEVASLAARQGRAVRTLRCRRDGGLFNAIATLVNDVPWQETGSRARRVGAHAKQLVTSLQSGQLLVIEDWHWADEGSVEVLELAVAGLPDGYDLAVLITSRPLDTVGTDRPGSSRLFRDLPTIRHAIEGFSEPEVFELIDRATHALPSTQLSELLHVRSGGNPLLALTGLQGLRSHGTLRWDGARLAATGEVTRLVPADLAGMLEEIVERLDPLTLAMVREAACSPHPCQLVCLPSAAGTPRSVLLASLAVAEEAGLIEFVDERVSLRHDLYRHVMNERESRASQVELHRAMFDHQFGALESLDDQPVEVLTNLAHHADLAGDGLAVGARFRILVAAADRTLTATDWATAARLYRAPLALVVAGRTDTSAPLELRMRAGAALFAPITRTRQSPCYRVSLTMPRCLARSTFGGPPSPILTAPQSHCAALCRAQRSDGLSVSWRLRRSPTRIIAPGSSLSAPSTTSRMATTRPHYGKGLAPRSSPGGVICRW